MEYSLYINQKAAVAWGLNANEALMFSYLINSGIMWMKPLPEDPRYRQAGNRKLAVELPIVCNHEGTARRHMATLENKGLIERIVVRNRSYFRITDKGLSWKSDTLVEPNESVCPENEAKQNGSAKPNESVRPRPNESVRQSDKPSLSNKPVSDIQMRKQVIDLPDWIPTEKWMDYLASRKSMKKHPMTAPALELCIKAIAKTVAAGYTVDAVLDQMIETGWRTVKPDWMGNAAPAQTMSNEEIAEELREELRQEAQANAGR